MPSWTKILKNFDKRLDHDEIDEFLEHLNASVKRRVKKLEEEKNNLSLDQFDDPRDIDAYRDHLDGLAISSFAAKVLGDELSIVALYKKVEAHTGRVVNRMVPAAASKTLSFYPQLRDALPFDIKSIDRFMDFNELRLVNNSIKHGGKVLPELAKDFPHWKEGAEMDDLDKAFQRLLPGVKCYVADLAERLHASAP